MERDILTLLRHLTNNPLTLKEIRRELIRSYSELQIQEAILNLLEEGLIEMVYTCNFELGFRPKQSS